MENLSKSLYSSVSKAIDEYVTAVSAKYSLSKDELLELWNNKVSEEVKSKASAPRTQSKAAAASTSSESKTCSYEFKKGKNANQKCTSKTSGEFCKKHEGKTNVAEKSEKPAPKKKAEKASEDTDSAVVKKLNESKNRFVLRKNKYGNFEHPETSLLFNKETKEVYGKQTDSGVRDLTEEDIELCKKFNFKYKMPETLKSTNDDKNEEESEDDLDDDEDDDLDEDDEDAE